MRPSGKTIPVALGLSLMVHGGLYGVFSALRVKTLESLNSTQDLVGISVMSPPHPSSNGSATRSAGTPRSVGTPPALKPSRDERGAENGTSPLQSQKYATQIRSLIEAKLRYPLALRRRQVAGVVNLKLTLTASGRAEFQEVTQSSGFPELDALAIEAAQAAQPYPAPEAELMPSGKIVLHLPIEFKLR